MTIVVLDSAAEDIKAGKSFYDSRETASVLSVSPC
jgi:hypothetical protein